MKKFLLLATLFMFAATASSQHILIENSDKSSSVMDFTEFGRITFNGSDVNIVQKNGSSTVYSMEEISRIVFGDYTGIESTVTDNKKIITYISTDEIAVNCAAGEIINIYNINGSYILSVRQQSEGGSISIAQLAKGIYLLQVSERTAKFIKR